MTGRERLSAILGGETPDRLAWTALVDHNTLEALPPHLREMTCLDFYRYIGCDVLQLGGWGLPQRLVAADLLMPGVEVYCQTDEHGFAVGESRCRRGKLTWKTSPGGHPIEYPIKSADDIRLLISRYEESRWQAIDERETFGAIEEAVGDAGITALFPAASPIPLLLQVLIGIENSYYFMQDYRDQMEALIGVMQERDLERYEIIAHHPCAIAILCENTSTTFISPQIYERYNMPSQQAFVEAQHRHGKTALLHMCGHVLRLLPMIAQTDPEGIHCLTPPPVGDTPWEKSLDILGDDLIVMACLPPDIWISGPVQEIGTALDRIVTPRLRAARFVLCAMADGLAVPLERFLAVRDWVEARCNTG